MKNNLLNLSIAICSSLIFSFCPYTSYGGPTEILPLQFEFIGDLASINFENEISNTTDCLYTLNVNYSPLVCSNQSNGNANVTVTGGTNVDLIWSTNDTSDMISNLIAGDYYVAASDSFSCHDTVFFSIEQSLDTLYVSQVLYDTISCDDSLGSIEIILDEDFAPYIYSWSSGDSTNRADSLDFGIYTVTISNKDGCGEVLSFETIATFGEEITYYIEEVSIYLDENGKASAYENAVKNLMGTCSDSLFVLYSENEYDCSNLGTHFDTVAIYNYSELIQEEIVEVTVFDTLPPTYSCPFPDTIPSNFISCGGFGGVIFVNLTIPGDSIKDNCSLFDDQIITYSLSYDTSGYYDYSFDISDDSGNLKSCTIVREIVTSPEMFYEYVKTDPSCFGESDGCIELNISGGTPPYSYYPEELCELSAGVYNVYIFDSLGCEIMFEVDLDQPDEIIISEDEKGAATEGENDGFIDVFVEGGNEPYSYEWTENGEVVSNLEDLVNFPASQYELVVTDANGCTQTFSSFIDLADNIKNEAFAQIKIYPTPFNQRLVIAGTPNNDAEISLINILGQKISIPVLKNNSQGILNTSDLANGVYFVNIRIDNEMQSYKLIKSN